MRPERSEAHKMRVSLHTYLQPCQLQTLTWQRAYAYSRLSCALLWPSPESRPAFGLMSPPLSLSRVTVRRCGSCTHDSHMALQIHMICIQRRVSHTWVGCKVGGLLHARMPRSLSLRALPCRAAHTEAGRPRGHLVLRTCYPPSRSFPLPAPARCCGPALGLGNRRRQGIVVPASKTQPFKPSLSLCITLAACAACCQGQASAAVGIGGPPSIDAGVRLRGR